MKKNDKKGMVMFGTTQLDVSALATVDTIVDQAAAFSIGTMRSWLYRRRKNGLSSAVLKLDENIYIDITRFNIWLSLDKDSVSDFRDLRTKQQLLESSGLKPSKLDDWLKKRHYNGLDEAVVKKTSCRLYIDVRKLGCWLLEQNKNTEFDMFPVA